MILRDNESWPHNGHDSLRIIRLLLMEETAVEIGSKPCSIYDWIQRGSLAGDFYHQEKDLSLTRKIVTRDDWSSTTNSCKPRFGHDNRWQVISDHLSLTQVGDKDTQRWYKQVINNCYCISVTLMSAQFSCPVSWIMILIESHWSPVNPGFGNKHRGSMSSDHHPSAVNTGSAHRAAAWGSTLRRRGALQKMANSENPSG